MKDKKMTNAMSFLDEDLIAGAMTAEEKGNSKVEILDLDKRRKKMTIGTMWKKWVAVAAMLALLVSGSLVIGKVIGNANAEAIVAFDVNPSLEIRVNSKEEVIEVKALNEDATVVLGDMKLEGTSLTVAVNAIIGSMMTNGYITADQNSILISIDSRSNKKAESLQAAISEKVTALLGDSNIEASVLTQIFDRDKTSDGNISAAKAALVEKIVASGILNGEGAAYTYEELKALKVHELKLILESKGVKVDGLFSSGSASDGKYIGREEAIRLALERAGFDRSEVTGLDVEIDFSSRYMSMAYEVDFEKDGMEYEYELLGTTGEIVKEELEPAERDDGDEEKVDIELPEGYLGIGSVKELLLAELGLSSGEVYDYEIELEFERGRIVYSVEFETRDYEFEFQIAAKDGEVIASSKKANRD